MSEREAWEIGRWKEERERKCVCMCVIVPAWERKEKILKKRGR